MSEPEKLQGIPLHDPARQCAYVEKYRTSVFFEDEEDEFEYKERRCLLVTDPGHKFCPRHELEEKLKGEKP